LLYKLTPQVQREIEAIVDKKIKADRSEVKTKTMEMNARLYLNKIVYKILDRSCDRAELKNTKLCPVKSRKKILINQTEKDKFKGSKHNIN